MDKNPKYNYLEIFSNLFFDVDKSENNNIKEIVQQVDIILSSVIIKLGEVENKLSSKSEKNDYNKSRTNLVIMTIIRKIMEQVDAINILYSRCSFVQAQVILRSMVENVIGLEFILKNDTDLRATAYYMEHHYQEIQKAKDFFGDDSFLKGKIPNSKFELAKEESEKKEQALNNLISKNILMSEVDSKRKSILASKKIQRINWYEIGGARNFYELMKEVNLDDFYSGIYGGLSFETHGLTASTEIMIKEDGNAYLNLIRSPHDGSNVFSLTCTFALSVLQKLYEYLGEGFVEKKEFREYYEWLVKNRDNVDNNLGKIVRG